MIANSVESRRIRPRDSLVLALLLFAFWVVLSGKLDLVHLSAGALFSVGIALFSCRLFALDPPIVQAGRHPFAVLPWTGLATYVPWLIAQILVSTLQVAKLVLSPRMEIRPKLFTFSFPLPHGLARATLANSITLTPGTVTIDVDGDEYMVHAINDEAARDLEGMAPGNMKERVGRLFGPESPVAPAPESGGR
jgi:multicomponent Na+:H+ antiporter subunit E